MSQFRSFSMFGSFGLLALLICIFIGLTFGATSGLDSALILELRLPRVLMAVAVGMGLAVAGVLLQALFSNPLCEPYTLGISSGAALGAVVGMSLGSTFHWLGLSGSAFVGALLFSFVLIGVSRFLKNSLAVLLVGVMLAFLGSSLVALWMSFSDERGIQEAFYWLLGDLSRSQLLGTEVCLGVVFLIVAIAFSRSEKLDALLFGEETAFGMGVEFQKEGALLLFLSSLLVGICVSAGGIIGFIGLVVPHFCRYFVGSLHRKLIPVAALWGAVFLTLAECVSRTLVPPVEIPVGVVTAIVGAPFFISLLIGPRGHRVIHA